MDVGASDVLIRRCVVKGHTDWVTSISTPSNCGSNIFISASRDKKLVVWKLDDEHDGYCEVIPARSLESHFQTVQDCDISNEGSFAISASWDKMIKLWDLEMGIACKTFKGHTSGVMSVAFSPDNRQIISSGRDRTIKLWNALAHCKLTLKDDQHTDWISCVRFIPRTDVSRHLVISCSWDKLMKSWDIADGCLDQKFFGHEAVLNTLAVSDDGTLVISGGKEGVAMLWEPNAGNYLTSIDFKSPINKLSFTRKQYWVAGATDENIQFWSLEPFKRLAECRPDQTLNPFYPWCTALCWTSDSKYLLAGTRFGEIYVYKVNFEAVKHILTEKNPEANENQ